MEKKILILGDFVGYGNVAMATSRAVLTKMGCTVFCLPTALISNTWNFGQCAVLDTTDYLRRSLENWQQLGFRLDAVLIGYLADAAQAAWVAEQCKVWHEAGIAVFLDPIFADNGKLYHGIDAERIGFLRELLKTVDYVLPNATEAAFLGNTEHVTDAMDAMEELGAGTILVTGAGTGENRAVLLRQAGQTREIAYRAVPGNYSGAGDAFTALFAGGILSGLSAEQSAENAANTTREWILRSLGESWQGMGLPVERYF